MRIYRRSRMKSTRGHVRIEQGTPWGQWVFMAAIIIVLVIVLVVLVSQLGIPALEEKKQPSDNCTWLEYAWTAAPTGNDAILDLGQLLTENGINRIYLEAAAWLSDGSLVEGEYAASFAENLRAEFPQIEVLLWLRMSGDEIADPERQAAVIALTRTALQDWQLDGVQLNGRAVFTGSEAYIQLVRALREVVGSQHVLSLTVPPDRIPTDPDVPIGTTADPELTWNANYKQRVGLLGVDEMVVMAHASGLTEATAYQVWVAYQVQSYAETMSELERPPDLVIALPTYDAAPEHDPAVETIQAAVSGVKDGIAQAGRHGDLIHGVGLYEYKFTDSLEWALFAEYWLGQTSK